MADTAKQKPNFTFYSSTELDVWNGPKVGDAYEWWYFDALSDDGKDAVVIIFLDNFVFSPRYNHGGANADSTRDPVPAVAFTYYRDGRPVQRVVAEYPVDQFEARSDKPTAKFGGCSFEFKEAPYGNGYVIDISMPLKRGKTLNASFEWLEIESDLSTEPKGSENGHVWNLVAPRCDVTGTISIENGNETSETKKFRGTGYHDHNSDTRWLPNVVDKWFWGRAHFPFATAVFYHFREKDNSLPMSRLYLIREGRVDVLNSQLERDHPTKLDKFGLRYPTEMTFTGSGIEMKVRNSEVIDSSFFYLRFINEMEIRLDDKHAVTNGISEYLKPDALRKRWVNWLIDFRIARNGKAAFLK